MAEMTGLAGAVVERCPFCHGAVSLRAVTVPIHLLSDPPRQVEPYLRITHWQCHRREDHHGEYSTPRERP